MRGQVSPEHSVAGLVIQTVWPLLGSSCSLTAVNLSLSGPEMINIYIMR